LGPTINTPYDERGPFFHPDGKTLYFSSEGHNSMGGLDVFEATMRDNFEFTPPRNVGYPVNTPDDDVYFVMSANGKRAYYASAMSGGYGDKDIYMVTFRRKRIRDLALDAQTLETGASVIDEAPGVATGALLLLKGKVFDDETGEPVEANLTVINNANGEEIAVQRSNSVSGRYLVALPGGKNYGIAVETEGYLFHSENFEVSDTADYAEIVRDIRLKKIKIGQRIVLRNIFFDFDKFDLRPESKTELDRLLKIMVENPTIRIRINGHTDNKGSRAYNITLSNNRAKAVVDYLVAAGIAKSRLEYQGFAFDVPIDTNDTDEGRQNNRRTEFEIIE
jgi:outer membrane protein OmpA-like peptidoglycan-associated protein